MHSAQGPELSKYLEKSLKRRSEAFATLCPEVAQPNAWEEKEVVKSDTQ